MIKKSIFFLFTFGLFLPLFAQKKANTKPQSIDFEVISKELQFSYPGKSGGEYNKSTDAGSKGNKGNNTPPSYKPQYNNIQRTYLIRVRCLIPSIFVDSIYYNGYIVGNDNLFPQFEQQSIILTIPFDDGTQKPFTSTNPKDAVILKYKKNGKIKYFIIKDIPRRIFENG